MTAADALAVLDGLERYIAGSAPGANPEALERVERAVLRLRRVPLANGFSLAAIQHWSTIFFNDREHGLYAGGASQVRRFILDELGRLRTLVRAA